MCIGRDLPENIRRHIKKKTRPKEGQNTSRKMNIKLYSFTLHIRGSLASLAQQLPGAHVASLLASCQPAPTAFFRGHPTVLASSTPMEPILPFRVSVTTSPRGFLKFPDRHCLATLAFGRLGARIHDPKLLCFHWSVFYTHAKPALCTQCCQILGPPNTIQSLWLAVGGVLIPTCHKLDLPA